MGAQAILLPGRLIYAAFGPDNVRLMSEYFSIGSNKQPVRAASFLCFASQHSRTTLSCKACGIERPYGLFMRPDSTSRASVCRQWGSWYQSRVDRPVVCLRPQWVWPAMMGTSAAVALALLVRSASQLAGASMRRR